MPDKYFTYRNCAVNIKTGIIIAAPSVQQLRRCIERDNRHSRRQGQRIAGAWRFCHDYGEKWRVNGLPRE